MKRVAEPEYQFAPSERPIIPGSAAIPAHPTLRKVGYVAIAILVAITATFGNALVTVNVPNLSGASGGYVTDVSWLPAVYVAFSACANLMLVKARVQFGLANVTRWLLLAYALAAALQFLSTSFAAAVLLRAISGVDAALLAALALYNMMQVFPANVRPRALVAGIGLQQLGVPLARLVPVDLLSFNHWQGLHLLEIGGALAALAAITALPLPQVERAKVFEPLDFVTIGFFLPAMLLVCCVLNQGRLVWWFDTPWIGWALAAVPPLLAISLLIESRRSNPLLQVGWMGSFEFIRIGFVAVLVRLALAEQTYGAVGLLTSGGLDNDQLHMLFLVVAVSMILGTLTAMTTLTQPRLRWQIMAAALLIALGSWIESFATNLTRPPQLFLSEALISFGTTMFIGPALVFGFLKTITHGPSYLITFLVLFNVSQNVGGLAGSAFLGTYEQIRARAHAEAISEHVRADDPQVIGRLQRNASSLAPDITDPSLRAAAGGAILARRVNSEATILAYNDVSQVVAFLALLTAGFLGTLEFSEFLKRRCFPSRASP